MYAYIDGDDIGLRIENSFMNNDEASLKSINNNVKALVESITLYLLENNYEIVFSGADGIICKKSSFEVEHILEFIRNKSENIKFSVGAGNTLRDAFLALRYAKSNGKDIGAVYNNGFQLFK
jgi:hypothetical protein